MQYACKSCGGPLPADMTKECPVCHPTAGYCGSPPADVEIVIVKPPTKPFQIRSRRLGYSMVFGPDPTLERLPWKELVNITIKEFVRRESAVWLDQNNRKLVELLKREAPNADVDKRTSELDGGGWPD